MADLTEYGKRYKGKKVTRKLVEAFNDEEEEEEDEDDEDDEEEEDEDEDEDEEEEVEDEADEEDEEIKTKKIVKSSKSENQDQSIKLLSDRDDDLEKGKVVRNQLRKLLLLKNWLEWMNK